MRHWYRTTTEASILDIGASLKMGSSSLISIDEEGDRAGVIRIGKNCDLSNAKIFVKLGASVVIGDNAIIKGQIIAEQNSHVVIGDDLVCNSNIDLRSGGGTTVSLGDGCLLADAKIYATDYHKIYVVESGRTLNPPSDIMIGHRVWLAMRTIVLKGSIVGTDSVVAAGSMVRGKFPPNCLLAGTPAEIKKRGIAWSR